MTYSEQLKDKRWLDFRVKVFSHYSGCGCIGCGDYSNVDKHEIHHIKYIKGRMAWEYEMSEVIPLCRGCHQKFHDNKLRLEKLVLDHALIFPSDFDKILNIFESELNNLKSCTNGEF